MALKLDGNEMTIIYQMMLNATLTGKDSVIFGKMLVKFENEIERLAPNTLTQLNNG